MTVFLSLLIGIPLILLGKYLFKKWFNPFSLYIAIWTSMVSLYELKLIQFNTLTLKTFLIIIAGALLFLLGVLTIYSARYSLGISNDVFTTERIKLKFFSDEGKIIKKIIFLTSTIGLLSAIQHWYVLVNEFGSIPAALFQAHKIYRQGIEGELQGVIPYIFIFSYVGVFFGGAYSAYKNKLTLIAVYPLLAVILKQIAFISRAGMLFGLLEFLITFFLFRHLLTKDENFRKRKNKIKIGLTVVIIFILVYSSASLVKVLRNPVEDYKASSRAIGKFEGGAFISPSIYLYASAHLGVLNQYFIDGGEDNIIGRNTFLPLFNILAKFDVVEDEGIYQKGYYIPMWTNTGTYLRELHADYGYVGIFVGPYLLGLLSAFLWYQTFRTKNMIYLLITTYVHIIISFSFLVIITRVSTWFLSLILLLVIVPLTEKYIEFKNRQIKRIDS